MGGDTVVTRDADLRGRDDDGLLRRDGGQADVDDGGTAAASDYQAALEAVAFNEAANTDPTHGGTDTPRTVTWSVTDINPDTLHDSASASSTLKMTHQAPIVSGVTGANAVVTYTEGQTGPTVLDSNFAFSDTDTLTSATVSVSGFKGGDNLLFGTVTGATLGAATTATVGGDTLVTETLSFADGTLTATFDETAGTLSLKTSGTASNADYQAALQAVAFTEAPGSDPTHGGAAGETARTVSWTLVDATNATSAASTALDTVHKPPVVTAGANVTYTGGDAPVPVDSTLTVTDSDSIKSAAVAITGGLLSGDVLDFNKGTNTETFTDGATISASYANGVLTLTTMAGTANATDYQTALDLVRFSNTGDPTNGGTDTARTLTWTVLDTNAANNTGSATSTLNTVHLPPSLSGTNGVTATYTEGQVTTTFLDSGFTVSNDTLTSATVAVSGFQTGDVLRVGNLDGLTLMSNANGTIVLSGSGTSLQYQTALDSISFSEVAGSDPTQGGNAAQTARSVTWTVVDDANSVASATTALDTVHTLSVKAGVTVTFAAGQTGPTFLDSALTVNDSDTVTSATVTVGGFQTGRANLRTPLGAEGRSALGAPEAAAGLGREIDHGRSCSLTWTLADSPTDHRPQRARCT